MYYNKESRITFNKMKQEVKGKKYVKFIIEFNKTKIKNPPPPAITPKREIH